MAPKSDKGKKPLIISPPTKKRKSFQVSSSGEDDVKTLLSQILDSVGELHQKTDLISERLDLLEEKVKEQKKKEIIFIKQWVGEKEMEGNAEVGDDEEEERAQGEDEEEKEENNEENAEDDKGKGQDERDDGKENDEEEEEGEKEVAPEFSSEAESDPLAPLKGHRYGLRSRSSTKFSNTADQPIILTPSSSSAASNP